MTTLADALGGSARIIGGPFGSNLTSRDYREQGVPVIRGSNMEVNGRWVGGSFAYVAVEKAERDLRSNIAFPGDIIVTQRGTLGQVSIIPDDAEFGQYVVSQSQMAVAVQSETACRDYVYYYLRSPQFSDYSHSQTIQTGVPHINLGILRNAPAAFPSIGEQRRVAAVLCALDDKIELNRKTAATLEEMARALYRSWFVDFDPVWAKAEGRTPAHMDAETAALFPSGFGDDGLPLGWRTAKISEIFAVTMGQSPPGETYNDTGEGLPFFQGCTDFGFRYPVNRKFCNAPSRIAQPESVLLSVRAPVGALNKARELCCIGRGVGALVEKNGRSGFAFYAINALSDAFDSFESEGTVFGSINKKQLEALNLVMAQDALCDRFEKIAGPIDAQIRNLTLQSESLSALRDTLLPKLMSGELRVGEAQKQLEEVL